MDRLSEKFPNGKVRITRYGKNGWKDVYKFFILRKEREEFIKSVYPFLIIKKQQANIVLELLKIMREQNASIRGKGGLTKSERDQRHDLASRIRVFNKKGVTNKNFSALRD